MEMASGQKRPRLPRINLSWLESIESNLDSRQEAEVKKVTRNFDLRAFPCGDHSWEKQGESICAVRSSPKKGLPALVVREKAYKQKWEQEIKRWTNASSVVISGRAKEGNRFKAVDANFTIINYDVLDSWESYLTDFRTVIFDDCDNLAKLSNRTYAAREVAKRAANVIAIIERNIFCAPADFFNAFSLVRPDLFTSFYDFTRSHCQKYKNKYMPWGFELGTCKNRDALWELLADFTILSKAA